MAGDVDHAHGLDVDHLDVRLHLDFVAAFDLLAGKDLLPLKQRHILGVHIVGQGVHRGGQVEQAAAFGLLHPCLVIAVAVEDDAHVRAQRLADQGVYGSGHILGGLQLVGHLHQGIGDGGVEDDVGAGDGLRTAQAAELELVAREGKGRGAVAVGGVAGEAGQDMHAQLHLVALVRLVLAGVDDALDELVELVAQKDGNNCGRGLVGAQAVIVARAGHGHTHQVLIIVHSGDDGAEEHEELRVFAGGIAGVQQVDAGIGAQGIVVVLAAAVDALEGLLMQQAHHAVPVRDLLHDVHGELVVIGGDVDGRVDGRHLMLSGGHLVVLGLGQDAQLPQLGVELLHEGLHAGFDDAEVVILQLLSLGRLGAKESAARHHQVGALAVNLLVHQEILLLRAHGGKHAHDLRVAEDAKDAQRLLAERLHGAQQGRLFVQRLPAIGAERRGDAQRALLDEGIAGGVPGGVATGLKGGTQAAGGERARVRFAAHQLLAAKLQKDLAVLERGDERVVLFSGHAGHGLKPVRIMRRAHLQRPVLHGVGHHARHRRVQGTSLLDGALQGSIGFLGQALLHHAVVKHIFAKKVARIFHKDSPFPLNIP